MIPQSILKCSPPIFVAVILQDHQDQHQVPGDSKRPFDPLVGGHLTPWKGHLTIPKRSLWITRYAVFKLLGGVSVVSFWWPPLWCSPRWTRVPDPFKPEAQKVVYKVKQNPARRGSCGEAGEPEQNGGPPLPSKETPQAKSTNKKWMVGRWSFPVVFFVVVAYFQAAWTAVSFREDSRPYWRGKNYWGTITINGFLNHL